MADKEPKREIILSIDEALYYGLWYEPQGKPIRVTPRFSPPPEKGLQPEVIPLDAAIWAEPVYLQPTDRERKIYPSIVDNPMKFLRATNSAALGPNSYLFAGEIVASDKYVMFVKDREKGKKLRDRWTMTFIIDCGVPLQFHSDYVPIGRSDLPCLENQVQDGVFFEGIVRLSVNGWSPGGLHQAVSGAVRGVKVLELDSASEHFGEVHEVPFGHNLTADPDILQQETVFATIDIDSIWPLAYSAIPARSEDCPLPEYEGMTILGDGGVRIVEIGKPKDT
jgi:hypothetical protein